MKTNHKMSLFSSWVSSNHSQTTGSSRQNSRQSQHPSSHSYSRKRHPTSSTLSTKSNLTGKRNPSSKHDVDIATLEAKYTSRSFYSTAPSLQQAASHSFSNSTVASTFPTGTIAFVDMLRFHQEQRTLFHTMLYYLKLYLTTSSSFEANEAQLSQEHSSALFEHNIAAEDILHGSPLLLHVINQELFIALVEMLLSLPNIHPQSILHPVLLGFFHEYLPSYLRQGIPANAWTGKLVQQFFPANHSLQHTPEDMFRLLRSIVLIHELMLPSDSFVLTSSCCTAMMFYLNHPAITMTLKTMLQELIDLVTAHRVEQDVQNPLWKQTASKNKQEEYDDEEDDNNSIFAEVLSLCMVFIECWYVMLQERHIEYEYQHLYILCKWLQQEKCRLEGPSVPLVSPVEKQLELAKLVEQSTVDETTVSEQQLVFTWDHDGEDDIQPPAAGKQLCPSAPSSSLWLFDDDNNDDKVSLGNAFATGLWDLLCCAEDTAMLPTAGLRDNVAEDDQTWQSSSWGSAFELEVVETEEVAGDADNSWTMGHQDCVEISDDVILPRQLSPTTSLLEGERELAVESVANEVSIAETPTTSVPVDIVGKSSQPVEEGLSKDAEVESLPSESPYLLNEQAKLELSPVFRPKQYIEQAVQEVDLRMNQWNIADAKAQSISFTTTPTATSVVFNEDAHNKEKHKNKPNPVEEKAEVTNNTPSCSPVPQSPYEPITIRFYGNHRVVIRSPSKST